MIKLLKQFILLLIALTIGFFVGYNFPKKYEELGTSLTIVSWLSIV
jgi:hypothetical protein